ncbi:hypothetical protein F751_3046 [Auxenochlorella protothecoides]|uniref:Uncharacterized protein n=1 Tax=Auxenochlorella protothecoides TaxID=3075 RepID=A0A087SF24_AUXPR|nr:hypothetical protein F751_3046 [Auxenochlorella protothecoides]KFM24328.1 hypothetical protein F751_3046 [Auxenochlorella protothecoides]
MLSVEDRRSVRLVCKAWSTAARETLTELCPDSYARPSRITRARYPSLESVDLTMLRGWGRAGEEYWLDLKHLTLGHSNGMRAQVLRQICRMPNLQSLHLSRKQLLPGSHAELANLPQSLRALSLTWVNGTSPQSSGDLTSLELGALWHGMLEAVAAVLSLPQLERLELRGCAGLDGGALRGLAGMPALRALRLSSCGQLDAAALAALGSAPALRDLALVNCRLEGMGGLAPLRGLRRLDLGGSTCAEEAGVHGGDAGKELAALARFPALAALGVSLEGGEALVARLAALAPLPLTALRLAHRLDLSHLTCPGTAMDARHAHDGACLARLVSLRCVGCSTALHRALAAGLHTAPSLEQASLAHGWTSDADVAPLAALPALRRLALTGTGRGASLSAGGLRALVGGSRSLARLVVDAGWDQDEGLSAALDAAPRVLCQVCEGEVLLDEALSATNLGRLEPFNPCRPAAE